MSSDQGAPQPSLEQQLQGFLASWQQQIRQWAGEDKLIPAAVHALGLGDAPPTLISLVAELAEGDFRGLPAVELMADDELPGARSHFSESRQTVYLNATWLTASPQELVLRELTVRWGEHLDVVFNTSDTPGDEGQHFQALLSADPTALPR